MANYSGNFDVRRPWARSGFDIEGWVGALAAILFGIFAGAFWYPLFIFGFIAAAIILAATRNVDRTMPTGEVRVIAPCDGIVSSVESAVPPSELGMTSDERTRIRLSSSPLSPNTLFAPMSGEVTESAFEEGNPSQLVASRAEMNGLEVCYLAIGVGDDAVGLKIMTAGFGPRLDVETETGDMLRVGRKFAKRRLGGWCDIYLPAGYDAAVWPGQTILGGETELAAINDTWVVKKEPASDAEFENIITEKAAELDLEELGTSHATETSSESSDEPASKLLDRFREEASKPTEP